MNFPPSRMFSFGLVASFVAVLGCCVGACSEGTSGSGELRVLLEAEDVILEGLSPGEGLEDIRDGWEVAFDEYLMTLGGIRLDAIEEEESAAGDVLYTVDLTKLPQGGLSLWTVEGLASGNYEFFYELGGTGDRHESVDEETFEAFRQAGLSTRVKARLTKTGGVSCPPSALVETDAEATGENEAGDACFANEEIEFEFETDVRAVYGPCGIEGMTSVAIAEGGATSAAITIHGDHLFFNGFPEGDEGGVRRLAQWLADCDLDVDGTVTMDELASIAPGDLSEIDDRFQLGGAPLEPLADMVTYLEAQVITQGHFQGEGECAFEVAPME